ncbi:hypothetical protein L208DRAFT_1374216 [Tricholoma matsutake]|nr:hypothetical protein L208DRAFT_1374216 [Tricholoma matsutake 945]
MSTAAPSNNILLDASVPEVPYEAAEVQASRKKARKPELLKMVARQKEKWPDTDFSGGSHVTVKRLKEVFGDPVYGFTKPALQLQPPTNRELAPSVLMKSLTSHVDTVVHSSSNSTNKPAALVGPRDGVPANDSGHVTRPVASGNVKHVPLTPVFVSLSPDPPRVWFSSAQELLAALQETCNNIEGATKMAFLDPVDVGYHQLILFVESHKHHKHPDSDNNSSDSYTSDVQSKKFKPLEQAKHHPPAAKGHDEAVQNARREVIEKELKWLRSKVAECNGYQEFAANQRRKQQNVGVVRSWKFIPSFSHNFFKKSYGVAVKKFRSIKKNSIVKALGISITSLAEAENAARLLGIFSPGGSHAAPEVVKVVEKNDETSPRGAQGLLPFLVGWENHNN